MSENYSEEELKQYLHDALWKALPDGKYRDEILEVEDIRIEHSDGFYTKMLVPNRALGGFGSDWDEETVDGKTVRYRIGETAGINNDEVWMEIVE